MRVKKFVAMIFVFGLALAAASFAGDAADVAIITYLEGDVQVRAAKGAEWEAAELEMGLPEGSSIKTGADSKAKFALEDDSLVVVGALSVLEITKVAIESAEEIANASFFLTEGMVRAEVAKLTSADSSFEIHTPTATAGVRGTDFMVEAAADTEETTVTVFDGEVELGNRRGKMRKFVRILKDHAADIRGSEAPGKARKLDKEKLEKLKKLMAHKMKDKLKGKYAELDDRKAAALLALRRAGMDKEMVSGLVSGMKSGEIPAARLKEVLSLAARGAKKDDVGRALSFIKDRQLNPEDIKSFVQAAKKRGDVEGIRDEIEKFAKMAGGKPGRKALGRDRLKEKMRGKEGTEELKEQIAKMASNLNRAEKRMLIGALSKGADPKFLEEVLSKLERADVDGKTRLLVLTAVAAGIPEDQIRNIITKLENKEITAEQVKEYIKKQIKENPPSKPDAGVPKSSSGKKK
ncbi:MAG: FecR family protein [bacterium]